MVDYRAQEEMSKSMRPAGRLSRSEVQGCVKGPTLLFRVLSPSQRGSKVSWEPGDHLSPCFQV